MEELSAHVIHRHKYTHRTSPFLSLSVRARALLAIALCVLFLPLSMSCYYYYYYYFSDGIIRELCQGSRADERRRKPDLWKKRSSPFTSPQHPSKCARAWTTANDNLALIIMFRRRQAESVHRRVSLDCTSHIDAWEEENRSRFPFSNLDWVARRTRARKSQATAPTACLSNVNKSRFVNAEIFHKARVLFGPWIEVIM